MEFIKAQITKIPHITPVNLSASTVLITGANTGLGLEAAREVLRSNPKRLILAVRNIEKGNGAKNDLERGKNGSTKIEVRKLDQGSFGSIQSLIRDLKGERVDIAILNAGVWNTKFISTGDGLESDLQVNTLGPALLAVLLLPNLRLASKTPALHNSPRPHLTFVSSGLHEMAKFPERKLGPGEILLALNDPKRYTRQDRYPVTKTIGLLWTRELASRVSSSEIIINSAAPGFCSTNIMRHTSGFIGFSAKLAEKLIGRSAADGARCLIDAAIVKGPETHGRYLSECSAKDESPLIKSREGRELQQRLWEEAASILEKHGLNEDALP